MINCTFKQFKPEKKKHKTKQNKTKTESNEGSRQGGVEKLRLSETERALITVSVKIPEKGIFSASGWIGALGHEYPV